MSQTAQSAALLLLAVLAANLPFVNQRVLGLGPQRQPKTLAWRLLELLVLYGLVGAVGMGMEQYAGQMAPQGWEFYAITASMFLTLAFPGFVYRHLMHKGD